MVDFKHYFENDYCGTKEFLEQVLKPVFGEYERGYDTLTNNSETKELAAQTGISKIQHAGTFEFYGTDVKIYDITVLEHINLAANKVRIQSIVRKYIDQFEGALLLFHHLSVGDREWRLSYVEKRRNASDTTSAKRYSYILGKAYPARTLCERFSKLEQKGSQNLTIADLTEAFSVEPISRAFFDEYRKHYADLVEYISGKRFVKRAGIFVEESTSTPISAYEEAFASDDKAVRDYVKKFMGRLVFLQFLQKKGWLAVPVNEEWGNGDKNFIANLYKNSSEDVKNNFLEQALEPLFFESLNTDRSAQNDVAPQKLCEIYRDTIRMPYLNGGLFEPDALDSKKVKFKREHIERLLDFFGRYNFTIDENDSEDTELGVDPEMLGKIFENLLEDNKDKGAFYTPKEIVEYMCKESLIAYLGKMVNENHTLHGEKCNSNEFDFDSESIRSLVQTHETSCLNSDQKSLLLKALCDVKICDPAVGSGAFPMGLLNELYALRIAVGDNKSPAEIKKEIVEENLYGVDIEKGAVDIARLRFWLSIIVDEDVSSRPQPLPNLDYKIMQGNSLVENFEGIDLSGLTQERENDLFDDCEDVEKLVSHVHDYFYTNSPAEKKAHRDVIKKTVIDLLEKRGINTENNEASKRLQAIDLHQNDLFFLWHTWFYDVFSKKGGFDIVIGNPPYIRLSANKGELANLYSGCGYESFERKGDIYCLFYEKAINLLNEGGVLAFITSNKWMRADYGKKLRGILSKYNPLILIDLAGTNVFENATVDPNIILVQNLSNLRNTKACKCRMSGPQKSLSSYFDKHSRVYDFCSSDSWIILSDIGFSVKQKIVNSGLPLQDWGGIEINYGVKSGKKEVFIIDENQRNEILSWCNSEEEKNRTNDIIRPVLRGKDIDRYSYTWAGLYLISTFPSCHYNIDEFPALKRYFLSFDRRVLEQSGEKDIDGIRGKNARKRTGYKWFETQDGISYWRNFYKPKLIYPETTQSARFAFDNEGMFPDKTCFIMISDDAAYLQATLSSELFEFAYKNIFSSVELGEKGYQYNEHALLKLPVKRDYNREKTYTNEDIYKLYGISESEKKYIRAALNSDEIEKTEE